MNAVLSNIRVTIVDLLGVLLPGFVWTILIFTLGNLASPSASAVDVSPWHTILQLCSGTLIAQNAEAAGVPAYVIVIIVSVLAGLVVKPVATRTTEWICFAGGFVGALRQAMRSGTRNSFRVRSLLESAKGYRFPYNAVHKEEPYFQDVRDLVEKETGLETDKLPARQPFACCKRILRMRDPSAWEDVLRREAEARMQGSLFLASILSVAMAGYAVHVGLAHSTHWLVGSLAMALAFMMSFRRLRRREVENTYLDFLLTASRADGQRTSPVCAEEQ